MLIKCVCVCLTFIWFCFLDFAELISLTLRFTALLLLLSAVGFLNVFTLEFLFFQRFTLKPLTHAFLTVPLRSVDVDLFLSLVALREVLTHCTDVDCPLGFFEGDDERL